MTRAQIATGVLCLLLLLTSTAVVQAESDLKRKLEVSEEIYTELYGGRTEGTGVMSGAVCIAVIPHVIKGAIGIGGHKGTGVISCKNESGWSPPAFLKMTGGSIGLQLGGEVSDVVLFFMTKRGVESLLETKFTLGGEVSVAAGPYGESAEANTDLKFKAEIYSYAKSRGLFAGVSLEGGRLAVSQKLIRRYYGKRIWPNDLLFENMAPTVPAEARAFMEALPGD
jgi:lipid-binding SYLF domain-containing protein